MVLTRCQAPSSQEYHEVAIVPVPLGRWGNLEVRNCPQVQSFAEQGFEPMAQDLNVCSMSHCVPLCRPELLLSHT